MRFLHDLKPALRGLLRTPVFTVMALFTLALGIGANTAIFSVIQAVFLKPLPYTQPQELVYLHVDSAKLFPDQPTLPLSAPYFRAIQERQTTFTDVAVYAPQRMVLTGHGDAERLKGFGVTGSLFPLVGVKPLLGRTIQPLDEGGAKVVLLSHSLWRDRFQQDPNLLGHSLTLNGQGYAVVGVLPPAFRWQGDPQFFAADGPTQEDYRGEWLTFGFKGLGRLKPGLTMAQAQADLTRIHGDLTREKAELTKAPLGAMDYRVHLYGDQRAKGLMLGLTGALVLLIAYANLANLMVSRAAHRQRELALRQALGGTRMDGLRPFLAEGLLVAVAFGLGAGAVLALTTGNILKSFVFEVSPSDPHLLALGAITLGLVALAATLIPASRAARVEPSVALRSE